MPSHATLKPRTGDVRQEGADRLGPGSRIGPYEIAEFLGAGGMGEVYRAHDLNLDRIVALKLLPIDLLCRTTSRPRSRRRSIGT